MLAEAIAEWRPKVELNIEGYPDARLPNRSEVRREQCTLVPDAPEAFTSEEGWKLRQSRCRWSNQSSLR